MKLGNSVEKPSVDSYYVPPPQLPAVVFNSSTIFRSNSAFDKWLLIIILSVCFISTLTQAIANQDYNDLLLICILLSIAYLSIRIRHKEIILTSEYVIKKHGFNKSKQATLELHNFTILIKTETSTRGSNNYSYWVYLLPKILVSEDPIWDKNTLSKSCIRSKHFPNNFLTSAGLGNVQKKGGIPISIDIYTPENLKEYVKSINAQLSTPLPILFGDEQATLDYTTEKFKTKPS
jgi:hypothetical protein